MIGDGPAARTTAERTDATVNAAEDLPEPVPAGARIPDFFVVGAPRSATTFLYTLLRSHPRIFLPEQKEPMYLCSDLDTGALADDRFFMRDPQEYFALFAPARADQLVGEACANNLFSQVAARRIRALNPGARIVISLRNPIEQMHSFHAQRVGNGTENLNFAAALAAEPDRLQGRRLPPYPRNVKMYQYRAVASYADQVARYLDAFPREQICILIYEELTRDPRAVYEKVLAFLGLAPAGDPDFGVVNANRSPHFASIARALRNRRLTGGLKRVVPSRLHGRFGALRAWLKRSNRSRRNRDRLDQALRRRLQAELRPDVERLGVLVGRDLAAVWGYRPEDAPS